MTETITTNENQPKEEKIKRLIQTKIDVSEVHFWSTGMSNEDIVKASTRIETLKELQREIETL